jgi:hypothetical protein
MAVAGRILLHYGSPNAVGSDPRTNKVGLEHELLLPLTGCDDTKPIVSKLNLRYFLAI